MSAKMRSATNKLDDVIKAYELMPASEIDEELSEMGIDPRPTIEAVMTMVIRRFERSQLDMPRGPKIR